MLKLRTKFILYNILIGLAIVLISGLTIWVGIRNVRQIAIENYDTNYSAFLKIQKIVDAYKQKSKIINNLIDEHTTAVLNSYKKADSQVQDYLKRLQEENLFKKEVNSILTSNKQLTSYFNKLTSGLRGDYSISSRSVKKQYSNLKNEMYKINELLIKMENRNETIRTENRKQIDKTYNRIKLVSVLILLFLISLSSFGGLLYSQKMLKSLSMSINVVQKVAQKDLTAQMDLTDVPDDEVGLLVNSINQLVINLKNIMNILSEVIFTLNNSIFQISSSAETISNGASKQDSTIMGTVQAMDQLSSSITQVSSSAKEVRKLTEETTQEAIGSGESVKKMVQGMNAISDRTEKIVEIIDVIDDIAEQTNLLAFNAAIEAARAGEHGRGFAVVAQEIRKLAEKSAQSTKDIASLIKDSVGVIKEGDSLSHKAGTAIENILSRIKNINMFIHKISITTSDQVLKSKNVTQSLQNVNQVTKGNSTAAGDLIQAINQLKKQADDLGILITEFKVREQEKPLPVTAEIKELPGL